MDHANTDTASNTGVQPRATLLVLGAGPKGLAIAAKQHVLRQLGYAVPQVVLVDASGVAAQWSGRFGYTDGRRLLGTLPEKDIGFPYDSTCWGSAEQNRAVDRAMLAYAWQTHLIEAYRYSEWIDRGRTRPTHRQWAAYLRWVAKRVEADVRLMEVARIGLTSDGGRWRLVCRDRATGDDTALEGDGLVLTGPGTPVLLPGQPDGDPRVLDGSTVWLALDRLRERRSAGKKQTRIGIIGTGETAAATVVALLETLGEHADIEVLSPRGVLYSRDEGFEENQLFSNPDPHTGAALGKHARPDPSSPEAREELTHSHAVRWLSLTEQDRREFVRRADRGVFSVLAMQEMTQAWNVRSVTGNAIRLDARPDAVMVESVYGGETRQHAYDLVVVARGFDPIWFLRLLDEACRARLVEAIGTSDAAAFERAIETDLSVAGVLPRLHLPMLAGVAQGPGFPNLSCLGLLSDRVLSSYTSVPPAEAMERTLSAPARPSQTPRGDHS